MAPGGGISDLSRPVGLKFQKIFLAGSVPVAGNVTSLRGAGLVPNEMRSTCGTDGPSSESRAFAGPYSRLNRCAVSASLRWSEVQLAKPDARKERRSKFNDHLAFTALGNRGEGRCDLVASELVFGKQGLELIPLRQLRRLAKDVPLTGALLATQ